MSSSSITALTMAQGVLPVKEKTSIVSNHEIVGYQ